MQRLIRLRAFGLILGLLLVVAAIGALLISYLLSQNAANIPEAPRRTIANTDVNPYGANFFLEREVEPLRREETVKMAAEAGIGWAKQQFIWAQIEPQDVDFQEEANWQKSWGKYDDLVELCARYGLQIIARLDHPPDWSRQDNSLSNAPPDNLADYADFVYGFVKHYQGRVRYIQIWNEPNIFPEWGRQTVDAAAYVEMLKVAYQAAKAADPNIYVLSAPLAPTLEDFPARLNLSDLIFLDEMYQAGAAEYFDILSANAFGFDLPPEDPPAEDKLNFQRVRLQRAIMERYGDSDKAIWINEYGWNASPETFAEKDLVWKRVTEEQQADYLLRGIALARQEWPWVGVFNIWYFRQVDNYTPEQSAYYFRMVDVDFTPRPVYYAVKDAAASLHVAGAGYFEESNPALSGGQNWQLVIDATASGGAYLVCRQPNAALSFTFSGDAVELITRRGPDGGRLLITLDGRRVPGLPLDSQGRSYLDLYHASADWIRMPLADGVSGGQHTLRLTVSETVTELASDSLCVIDAFGVHPAPAATLPVLPLVGLGIGMTLISVSLYFEITRNVRRR
ncbi:MAG: hypothetical protein ACOYZ7_07890 [Chloroflexota bacterium]